MSDNRITTARTDQSDITTTPRPTSFIEVSPEMTAALSAAGIDPTSVRAAPTGVVYVDRSDGGYIAFGDDDGWITATGYTRDGDEYMIYEGESIGDLVAAIVQAR